MTDVLSTDQRRQGFKRLLKLTSHRRLKKEKAVKKLTREVRVASGQDQKIKDPVYKDSESASDLVKDVVSSDSFPVERKGEYLVRQDVEYVGGMGV